MSETLTRAVSPLRRVRRRLDVLVVVLAASLLFPLSTILADGARTHLTIDNGSDWIVAVELVEPDGRTLLCTTDPRTTTSIDEVLVPDGPWRVRFRFAGEELATIEVSHAQLRASGNRIAVPAEIARELAARGVPPSP